MSCILGWMATEDALADKKLETAAMSHLRQAVSENLGIPFFLLVI
jgi:hypothetical protein